jgi:hypothetical protein
MDIIQRQIAVIGHVIVGIINQEIRVSVITPTLHVVLGNISQEIAAIHVALSPQTDTILL